VFVLLTLAALAAEPTPMAGLEFAPFSRADAVQVADGWRTGTGVGELDGTVWPSLRAFGGAWVSRHIGLTGHLGVARLTTTTWTDPSWVSRHVGVFRPGVDLRWSVLPRDDDRPRPIVLVGTYADIPSARVASNAFSPAEREQARGDAAFERARLGGVGVRAGAGADLRVHESISVGFLWTARLHRAVLRTTDATSVTGWLASEASLTAAFEWGPRAR